MEHQRQEEIIAILDLLDRKDPFFVDAELLTAMHEALFGTASWIASQIGHQEWFQRTFEEAAATFMPPPQKVRAREFLRMRVEAGRLIERNSQERTQLALPVKHDVFLSHYHGDSASADAFQLAIHELWPAIRIFRTKASEEEQRLFENYPRRFLQEARHAKCLVYLATPNSLGRAFIRQELGNNALRPIFTLLIGVNRADFENLMRRELYVAYQPDRIYDRQVPEEWRRFVHNLAAVLEIDRSGHIPAMPILISGPRPHRTEQEEGDAFLEWSTRTRGRHRT